MPDEGVSQGQNLMQHSAEEDGHSIVANRAGNYMRLRELQKLTNQPEDTNSDAHVNSQKVLFMHHIMHSSIA